MAIFVYAETSAGMLRKASLEASTYAAELAAAEGTEAQALVIGALPDTEVQKLAAHGITRIYQMQDAALDSFAQRAYVTAITHMLTTAGGRVLVLPQTYNARAIAPALSIRMDAALLSGVTSLPRKENGLQVFDRPAFSGKGLEQIATASDRQIITVKANSYGVRTRATGAAEIISQAYQAAPGDQAAKAKEIIRASTAISLTEADKVVSGGRGLKGPENWGLVESLADVLQAATACSKPVADVEWRPHHEHVGQTGIQIAPDLYIAIGISGAIQHLAGVNSSKVIVVINKDPEAPFFKAADYGIVGDAFEVVPRITQAIREIKKAG